MSEPLGTKVSAELGKGSVPVVGGWGVLEVEGVLEAAATTTINGDAEVHRALALALQLLQTGDAGVGEAEGRAIRSCLGKSTNGGCERRERPHACEHARRAESVATRGCQRRRERERETQTVPPNATDGRG